MDEKERNEEIAEKSYSAGFWIGLVAVGVGGVIAFGIVALIVWFIYNYINQQYINFVMNHSQAIKELKEINATYQFLTIPSFDMEHDYDNEVFYNNISPKDYLTYQLVYNQKNINAAIKGSFDNQKMHKIYINRVNSCTLDKYDTKQLPKNRNKLISTEKKLFNSSFVNIIHITH